MVVDGANTETRELAELQPLKTSRFCTKPLNPKTLTILLALGAAAKECELGLVSPPPLQSRYKFTSETGEMLRSCRVRTFFSIFYPMQMRNTCFFLAVVVGGCSASGYPLQCYSGSWGKGQR